MKRKERAVLGALALLLLLGGGCAETHEAGGDAMAAPEDGGPAEDASTLRDASLPIDAGAPAREVRLQVSEWEGVPERLFAMAKLDGEEVALLVDTGSQLTFLFNPGEPDGQPDVGTIELGGEERVLIGRPFEPSEIDVATADRPLVGILGNDYFFERPREVDLEAARIRTVSSSAPPGSTGVPYENRYDFIFVHAELDGRAVRLGFDTGAVHTLWLGEAPVEGDWPRPTQDAYGNDIILYQGTTVLTLDDAPPRVVPVLRAPSFPSLEDSNEAIGGGIDGLFGLSSIGARRFRIDAERAMIWFD